MQMSNRKAPSVADTDKSAASTVSPLRKKPQPTIPEHAIPEEQAGWGPAPELGSSDKSRYKAFIESFIPVAMGGMLEATLLDSSGSPVIEGDDDNDTDRFRVLCQGRMLSHRKLLLLCKLEQLMSMSDETFWDEFIPLVDSVNAVGQEGRDIIEEKTKEDFGTINVVFNEFHPGALTKAGICAMRGCMLHDMESAQNFEVWVRSLYKMCCSEASVNHEEVTCSTFRGMVLKMLFPFNKNQCMGGMVLHACWDELQRNQVRVDREMIRDKAQELDRAYALMVHGASVKISLTPDIWCAHEHQSISGTGRETEQFFKVSRILCIIGFVFQSALYSKVDQVILSKKVNQGKFFAWQDMWNSLGAMAVDWYKRQKRGYHETDEEKTKRSKTLAQGVEYVKGLWEQSKVYRVSDTAMMAEKQIIARLQAEGQLALRDSETPDDMLVVAFIMRRHLRLRSQFASAVAKRMYTERMTATSKASTVEHRRSANWSELEFDRLCDVMRDQGGSSMVAECMRSYVGGANDEMTCDYAGLLSSGSGNLPLLRLMLPMH